MADTAPEWEVSKENFQPLKTGRSAKGISTPVQKAPRQAFADAEGRSKQFQKEIAAYQGDDPLALWIKYIKWTQEAFTAGGIKAQLIPLLERCTRELKDVPQCKDDPRYLRIWIQYADCVPEPKDIFVYLKDQGIGQGHALYYEAYASFLELRRAFSTAKAVYEDGIAKYAAPLDRLQNKFKEFQDRMVLREERRARGEMAPEADMEAATDENGRRNLGDLSTRARGRTRPAPVRQRAGGLSSAQRPAAPPAGGNENAGGLEVFVDPEFGGAHDGPAYEAPRVGMNHLATFDQGRKENTAAPAPWAGTRLPQSRRAAAPAPTPAAPLDVLEDEELADAPGPAPVPQSQIPLRQQLDAGPGVNLQSVLEHNPLRLHTVPQPAPQQQSDSSRRQAGASKAGRPTKLAYNSDALRQDGSAEQEMSFEELRAVHLARMGSAAADAAQQDSHPAATSVGSPARGGGTSPTVADPSAAQILQSATSASPRDADAIGAAAACAQSQRQHPASTSSTGPANAAAPAAVPEPPASAADDDDSQLRAQISQELMQRPMGGQQDENAHSRQQNTDATPAARPAGKARGLGLRPRCTLPASATAAASAEGNVQSEDADDAFAPFACSEPLHGVAASSPFNFQPSETTDAADVTACSAEAFDAFAGAFSGPVIDAPSSLPEPTVTINTREAFAAINGMFSSSLPIESMAPQGPDRPPLPLPPRRSSLGVRPRGSSFGGANRRVRRSSILPNATATLPICEDTEYFGGADLGATATLPIREDTQFLGSVSDQVPAVDETGSLLIREDTQFLGGGDFTATGGLGIREDTQFCAPQASAPADETGSLLLVREDTQFLPSSPAAEAAGGLSFHDDTHPRLLAPSVPASGAAAAAAADLPEEEFEDEKENLPMALAPLPTANAGGGIPLRVFSQEEAAARGIELDSGLLCDDEGNPDGRSMHEILAEGGSNTQDDFEVYRDAVGGN